MRSFMAFNGRRPCPADGQYSVNSKYFGQEAANPGSCTGGTPSAPMGPDSGTGEIVAGTIPVRSLGLPEDYAFDSYGRPFTYTVDMRASDSVASARGTGRIPGCYNLMQNIKYNTGITSGLMIKDSTNGNILDHTMYAYISHGPSGYGAFPPQGSSVAKRINSGSTDADMQTNAGVNSNFIYNTAQFTNVRVKKDRVLPNTTPGDTGFDDLLWYRDDIKNTCCLGAACLQPGFAANGSTTDQSGYSVATGDINGDGIADLIIGAPNALPNGNQTGAVYVVFGTRFGFPDPLPLNSLNGSNGFRLDGAVANGTPNAGRSVAAGDVNADGFGDIIIGAPLVTVSGNANAGSVYVVFGGKTGANNSTGTPWASCPCTLNPTFLNGRNGIEVDGEAPNDFAGWSVATGDVNNDTIPDLIIGAWYASVRGGAARGATYVVFGKKTGWSSTAYTLDSNPITGVINGTNGVEFDAGVANDDSGYSVATGDINGDGASDLIIGGWINVDVVFGNNPLLPNTTLPATGTGTQIITPNADSGLMVGQKLYASPGIVSGQYILWCNNSVTVGFPCTSGPLVLNAPTTAKINANTTMYVASTPLTTTFLNGANGIEFNGGSYLSGPSVAAGDINGDHIPDLIIGAPYAQPGGTTGAGSVYVVFGGKTGANNNTGTAWTSCPCTLAAGAGNFLNGTNGVEFDGIGVYADAGMSVAAGDINGDDISDLIIGAGAHVSCTGEAYAVFGRKTGWLSTAYTLDNNGTTGAINGTTGIEFDGACGIGQSVATGDINGDGIPDLVAGAYAASPGGKSNAGSTYVYYGKKKGWPTTPYNLGGL